MNGTPQRTDPQSGLIKVVSIVDQFLEHTRIFYFRNGGDEEYFIGSADLMKRNLESRVETVVPVETPALRQELRQIIDIQLADRRCAWDMRADGSYVQRRPRDGEDARSSQEIQIAMAEHRLEEATRLGKKIKRSGFRSGSQVRGR